MHTDDIDEFSLFFSWLYKGRWKPLAIGNFKYSWWKTVHGSVFCFAPKWPLKINDMETNQKLHFYFNTTNTKNSYVAPLFTSCYAKFFVHLNAKLYAQGKRVIWCWILSKKGYTCDRIYTTSISTLNMSFKVGLKLTFIKWISFACWWLFIVYTVPRINISQS